MSNNKDVDMERNGRELAALMNDPKALALMQQRLNGMVGTLSGYYETLPKVVRRRVRALKNLQLEATHLEAKYFEELHQLECKYAHLYEPLYNKRSQIVNGQYEPNDSEANFPEEQPDSEEGDNSVTGVPEFWLTVFKNVELIAANIEEHDEPILKHLTDVKLKVSPSPMQFTLEFHFSPNQYFTNSVLTKTYKLSLKVDEKDPFSFEGPEIVDTQGSKIDWVSDDVNPTLTVEVKKQRNKNTGFQREVPKVVQGDSFFNFFSPPQVPNFEAGEEADEETQELLTADFEMGDALRQSVVHQAVLYFTGEAVLNDDDYDDEAEDYMDDEEFEEELESARPHKG